MEKGFWKGTAVQLLIAAFAAALFSLFALSVAAIFVKVFLPPETVVTAVNWCVKCVAAFLSSCIFIKGERALLKGVGAGVLYAVLALILFSFIGGWHFDAFFLLELVVCGILGGAGALLGAKLRKA